MATRRGGCALRRRVGAERRSRPPEHPRRVLPWRALRLLRSAGSPPTLRIENDARKHQMAVRLDRAREPGAEPTKACERRRPRHASCAWRFEVRSSWARRRRRARRSRLGRGRGKLCVATVLVLIASKSAAAVRAALACRRNPRRCEVRVGRPLERLVVRVIAPPATPHLEPHANCVTTRSNSAAGGGSRCARSAIRCQQTPGLLRRGYRRLVRGPRCRGGRWGRDFRVYRCQRVGLFERGKRR